MPSIGQSLEWAEHEKTAQQGGGVRALPWPSIWLRLATQQVRAWPVDIALLSNRRPFCPLSIHRLVQLHNDIDT